MIALSIVSPSGSYIAEGRKTIEVRSWQPDRLPLTDLLIIENKRYLTQQGDSDDNGLIVAVVDVVSVRPWLPSEVAAACASKWMPGHWAWNLTNVRRIANPVRAVAARRLYDVDINASALGTLLAS